MQYGNSEEDAPLEWRAPSASPSEIKKLTAFRDDSSRDAGDLMLLYALRRLIYLVPVAFGVSLLVFALVHLAPGDPISAIVPPDAPKELVDKLKEYYGFDKPLPVQYF